jgi:hypothetical protein
MNEYAVSQLVRIRLGEAYADADRRAALAATRPESRPLRARFGALLVRLGTRLLAGGVPARASA